MIAWYSRARSSLSLSINFSRVIFVVSVGDAVAIGFASAQSSQVAIRPRSKQQGACSIG